LGSPARRFSILSLTTLLPVVANAERAPRPTPGVDAGVPILNSRRPACMTLGVESRAGLGPTPRSRRDRRGEAGPPSMATILLLRVRPGGAWSLGDNPPLLGEPTTKAKSALSPPLLSKLGDVANFVDIGDASYIRALSDGCGVDLAEFILDAWRDATSSPSNAAMRVRSSRSWDWNACVLRMSRLLFRRRLVTSGSLCPPIGDGGMLRGGSSAL
jgi:hypothetical protein